MRVLVNSVLLTLLTIALSSSPAYALASEESMLTQARQHVQSGNYAFATTWLQCLLRDYPATSHRQEALLMLTKTAGSSGRSEKAIQYAAELLKEFPDGGAALDPELLKLAKLAPQPEPTPPAAVSPPAPLPEPTGKKIAKPSSNQAKAETPPASPAVIPAQPNAAAVQPVIKALPPVVDAVKLPPQTPASAKAPAQKPVAGGGNGFYTLLAGETVNRKKLEPLLKKLKVNGLQPAVRQEMKAKDVYRLVVACYNDNQSAREKQAGVARKVKEAFIVHEGDSHCIVAASLLSAEAAERGRQLLAGRGLPVTVAKAQVSLPVWRASVGKYTDAREAAGTVKKLAALAIEATLVKTVDFEK